MIQIAPSEEEISALHQWLATPGNTPAMLSRPERYLLALAEVARLKAKLAILVFKSQCEQLEKDTQDALVSLRRACDQVKLVRARAEGLLSHS